jgi:branched-chain amino acid transport system permease protein
MRETPIQLILLLLVASLPFWFIQTSFVLNVTILTFIFMSTSISWNIISGFGGQLSFGHTVFFGLGAYTSGLLFAKLHLSPWIGIFIGGLVASIMAYLLGYLLFRLKGVYFTLATFTTTLIFMILATHFDSITGGAVGFSVPLIGNTAPLQFQFINKLWFYYITLVLVAILFYISKKVFHSRLGLFLRAIKDDDNAAKASGVNDFKTKMFAFILSGFLTGIVVGVYLQYTFFIDPSSAFGLSTATQIAFLAIIGGAGRVWGPVLGAAILVPMQQFLSTISDTPLTAGLSQMAYALVIIVILLINPQGLISIIDSINLKIKTKFKKSYIVTKQNQNRSVVYNEKNK